MLGRIFSVRTPEIVPGKIREIYKKKLPGELPKKMSTEDFQDLFPGEAPGRSPLNNSEKSLEESSGRKKISEGMAGRISRSFLKNIERNS